MAPWLFSFLLATQVFAQSGAPSAAAAGSEDSYRVYTDPPRLLLNASRLRLLKRERDRQSARWQQFDSLLLSSDTLPEPGLSWALHYRVAGDAPSAQKAIQWALSDVAGPPDIRQLAFVFDWCAPAMSPEQTDRLAAKLKAFLAAPNTSVSSATSSAAASTPSSATSAAAEDADIQRQTARGLAAIALADQLPDHGEAVLRSLVRDWWNGAIVKKIEAGGAPAIPRSQRYLIYELMNAVRENLKIDLRDSAPEYFRVLPTEDLMGHYPVALQAGEDEYRVPVYTHPGDPDPTDAVFSRAAEMAMIALDTNAPEVQYVQGWLIQDRFTMRGPLGAPYEFLWANPYQPGLSYTRVPLLFHNPATGDVFARTDWDEDAIWVGYFENHLQLFRDGQIQTLKAGASTPPFRVGDALVVVAANKQSANFHTTADSVAVLSLQPRSVYRIEVDDQEMMEADTDVGGTLILKLAKNTDAGVRLKLEPGSQSH